MIYFLVLAMLLAPGVSFSKTTITTNKPDSMGYTRSTIQEQGKRTVRCATHTNSNGVVITKCT